MNHYIIHRNEILEPWAHSREVYGPVLTIYRGMAFTWQGGVATVMIDGDPHHCVVSRQLRLPSDGTLRTRVLNKKAWSRFVAAEAVNALTDIVHENALSVDRVPWAIHRIEDRTARDAATRSLTTETSGLGADFSKLIKRIGWSPYR